jgi:hypothetical protein
LEDQPSIERQSTVDRELCDRILLVFYFNRQIRAWQKISRMFENFRELARVQPVFDVIVYPGLQQAGFLHPTRSSTVDEALRDVPNFCDVKVCGNCAPVGQDEGHRQSCIAG